MYYLNLDNFIWCCDSFNIEMIIPEGYESSVNSAWDSILVYDRLDEHDPCLFLGRVFLGWTSIRINTLVYETYYFFFKKKGT